MDKILSTLYYEFLRLSEKKPNDTVNEFKLKIVNNILAKANKKLGNAPIKGFSLFDSESLPTNSDIPFVLALYKNYF